MMLSKCIRSSITSLSRFSKSCVRRRASWRAVEIDPRGFVKTDDVGTKGLSFILKQNNYLVQSVTTTAKKVSEISEQLQELQHKVAHIRATQKTVPKYDGGSGASISPMSGGYTYHYHPKMDVL